MSEGRRQTAGCEERLPVYKQALKNALLLMELCEELEPRSALKGEAAHQGIAFGEDMEAFVTWAEAQIFTAAR